MVGRRRLLAALGAGLAGSLAGCGGRPSTGRSDGSTAATPRPRPSSPAAASEGTPTPAGTLVSHGSTTYRDAWTVHLSPDATYVLVVHLVRAFWTEVEVRRAGDDRLVEQLQTGMRGTTQGRFTVPSAGAYVVSQLVLHEISTVGSASYELRRV